MQSAVFNWQSYIDEIKRQDLQKKSEEIGKLINYMINNPDKFGL